MREQQGFIEGFGGYANRRTAGARTEEQIVDQQTGGTEEGAVKRAIRVPS